MPRIGVLDPVGKRQILTDSGVTFNLGTVDVAAVFQDLLPDFVTHVELGEILVDDCPRVFTIKGIGPALGNLTLSRLLRLCPRIRSFPNRRANRTAAIPSW